MAVTHPPAPAGVLEAALYADDLAAAEAFYAGVLGLPVILRQDGRHVFFRVGGTILLVFRAAATALPPRPGALPVPPHGATGPGHLCLSATGDELDLWRAHLMASGVAIEADFRWPNGARSIYVRDPGSNSVEFAEPRLWFRDTDTGGST